MVLKRTDFTYELPENQIAAHPAAQRSSSKLLVWDTHHVENARYHSVFSDITRWLTPNDLLVFNDTRVQKARLLGHKDSGGAVEVLVERLWPDGTATAMIRASKAPKVGSVIHIGEEAALQVVSVDKPIYRVKGLMSPVTALMEKHGHVPLPPYIKRPDTAEDDARYQTVYAKRMGSAAAPTAGLHFDDALLKQLSDAGIRSAFLTLHVGLGTFAPVRVNNLAEHTMHAEWFDVPTALCEAIAETRRRGGRVVAVGTTTLRALETAAEAMIAQGKVSESKTSEAARKGLSADTVFQGLNPYQGESRLFITPGFRFRVVDALVTNFHLPESTLLMLVSAFAGHEPTLSVYREAVREGYRFFSFGDAMLITRCLAPAALRF